MRALTKVLDAVQRLLDQREDDFEDGPDIEEPAQDELTQILHLLDVKKGSAVYEVAAPDGPAAIRALRLIGGYIERPDAADWSQPTLSSLEDLSQVARSMGCEIEILHADGKGGRNVIARITPQTYEDIAGLAFVSGRTSIYARIEKVGGATKMGCNIRLPASPRKMVPCRVKYEELVRELGQYVYQSVLLSGEATWLSHNWKLKTMIVDSFEPPKTGSILKALEGAYKSGGEAWDQVDDPDSLIAGMRG